LISGDIKEFQIEVSSNEKDIRFARGFNFDKAWCPLGTDQNRWIMVWLISKKRQTTKWKFFNISWYHTKSSSTSSSSNIWEKCCCFLFVNRYNRTSLILIKHRTAWRFLVLLWGACVCRGLIYLWVVFVVLWLGYSIFELAYKIVVIAKNIWRLRILLHKYMQSNNHIIICVNIKKKQLRRFYLFK
jgi:hypothetical protein